jgi:Lysine-specific metallo-endopeptidase
LVFRRGEEISMSESLAAEVFRDLSEGEVDPLGEAVEARMVDPAKVDCAKLDRSLPIFKVIGTTDPVGVLETVCRRAAAMLDNTIAELTRIRARVRVGAPPAFPLIGDLLGWSLQTRMLMRASDPKAWTGSGPRTAEQIVRWLTNIRRLIASRDLWYTCLSSGCTPTRRAFITPGHFRIHLCRRFWRPLPGIDTATHLEFQAQTIIHEVSHIYYGTEDVGRGPGSAHCIAQFLADANGSPIRRQIIGRCGPGAPTQPHSREAEMFEESREPMRSQCCSDFASPSATQAVLFIGAERTDEFADAMRLVRQGHDVIVVNPRETAAARAFRRAGGTFLRAEVERLPRACCRFDVICENYPYPSGCHYVPPRDFALARLALLAPSGRWVLFTESARYASLLKAVADYDEAVHRKFRASLSSLSPSAAPPSSYPPSNARFRLIVKRRR